MFHWRKKMKSKLNGFKKAIAVVCGVCLSTVLAGCGGANGTGTESGNEFTLKFWSSGLGTEFLHNLVEDFEKDTGYKVKIEENGDTNGMYDTIMLGKGYNAVDLYMYNGAGPAYFDYVEPLDDVLNSYAYGESQAAGNKKISEKILPLVKGALEYNVSGTTNVYQLPYGGGWVGIVYNADMIDGKLYQIPRTTNELIDLANRISEDKKDQGISAICHFKGGGYWVTLREVFQAQYDGLSEYKKFRSLTSENGTPSKDVLLATDGRAATIDFLAELNTPDNVMSGSNTQTYDNVQTKFLEGKAAMMVNGSWLMNEMKALNDTSKNFKMMKTPIISSITDRLETVDGRINGVLTTEKDSELSAVVAAIDDADDNGKALSEIALQTENYDVSADDLAAVYEARHIAFSTFNDNTFTIPNYSDKKDIAKEFIRYFYSDAQIRKYSETLHMALPVSAEVDSSSWSAWGKEMLSYNALYRPLFKNANYDSKVFTLGGCDAWGNGDIIADVSNRENRKSAEAVWNSIKAYHNEQWNNYLASAGLK